MTALSALVVFSTTYALILPAITLDRGSASAEPGIELEEIYSEDGDLVGAGDIYFEDDPAVRERGISRSMAA